MRFNNTAANTYVKKQGFALLITLIIVSVVLAVGLSLLEITLKQISLSTTARDSEVSFHAANAASECAIYSRLSVDVLAGIPGTISFDCFEQSINAADVQTGVTHQYSVEFDWNNGSKDLCSQIDMFIIDAQGGEFTANFTSQGLNNYTCENGNVCTVAFSRGFNRACSELDSLRTVQRELTITY